MPIISANGVEIAFDERGSQSDPAIMLIMGLGTQMIAWPETFCDSLADRGFRVVRFDNRDIGLSTKFGNAAPIDLGAMLHKAITGQKIDPPYGLDDMAADLIGLMDGLGMEAAQIVGASMGGMIGQIVAANYPSRVRSLVSIMSSSGDPGLPQAKPEAMAALLAARPSADNRELAIQHGMKIYRAIGSPGFPTSDADLRAKVEAAFDRSYYPAGVGRQMVAILASGSRVALLKKIAAPTLVIHGADDPLVPVEAGKHTAAHIPGAQLLIIPGMGHDLAAGLVPILVDSIAAHCQSADRSALSVGARYGGGR